MGRQSLAIEHTSQSWSKSTQIEGRWLKSGISIKFKRADSPLPLTSTVYMSKPLTFEGFNGSSRPDSPYCLYSNSHRHIYTRMFCTGVRSPGTKSTREEDTTRSPICLTSTLWHWSEHALRNWTSETSPMLKWNRNRKDEHGDQSKLLMWLLDTHPKRNIKTRAVQ